MARHILVALLLVGLANAALGFSLWPRYTEDCLKKTEKALGERIVITDSIRQLMDTIKAHHNEKALIYIDQPNNAARDAVKALGYPKDCDTVLEESKAASGGDAKCLDNTEFDQKFRDLVAKNQKLDDLLGAGSTCVIALDMQ